LTRPTRQRYARRVTAPSPTRPKAPRTTRAVYGVYVLGVAAFVISSIVQVGRALFFGTPEPTTTTEAAEKAVGENCARLLEEHDQAIAQARIAASTAPDGDAARALYAKWRLPTKERQPELDQACAGDPHGADALAALARFDRAAESHAVRTASELSPVRLSAQSFIRGHHP
jgi:hypothetical protein